MSRLPLVDCHAHIYPPQFPAASLPQLLLYARKVGVAAIITVPEGIAQVPTVLDLADRFPLIQPCIGLHPVQSQPDPADASKTVSRSVTLQDLEPIVTAIRANAEQLVAVGECGLDFSRHVLDPAYNPPDAKSVQQQVFAAQIALAMEMGLPLNVHARQAGHYAIDMMVEAGATGVMHAFDGKVGGALKGVEAGLIFSVAPNVIRNEHLRKLVKAIPITSLVLETDSPALGPEPDVPNVPANLLISCQQVAQIKGLSVEEVARITTQNALRVFPRLKLQDI
ncbi:hypothetical protein DFS34DRAFT_592498 [Phlyctochytrium arcticum]|nr:hypothetical protein DFS34DRAFT_592498 [Phlyctochytrium arcticum]